MATLRSLLAGATNPEQPFDEWLSEALERMDRKLFRAKGRFERRKIQQVKGDYIANDPPEAKLFHQFHGIAVREINARLPLNPDDPENLEKRSTVYWAMRDALNIPSPGNFTAGFVVDPTTQSYEK